MHVVKKIPLISVPPPPFFFNAFWKDWPHIWVLAVTIRVFTAEYIIHWSSEPFHRLNHFHATPVQVNLCRKASILITGITMKIQLMFVH